MARDAGAAREPKLVEKDVRQRLVEAATALIAVKGIAATTVRDLTDAAGLNIAAVNYYFGSKDALVRDVLLEVFTPIRRARDGGLAAILAEFSPSPPPIEAVIGAWMRPLIDAERSPDGGRIIIRFMHQLRATPGNPYNTFVQQHFDYGAQAYIDTFGLSLAGLTRAEITWRYELMRGAALHILANCDPLSKKFMILAGSGPTIDTKDDEAVLRQVIQFCAAGFASPPVWTHRDLRDRSNPRNRAEVVPNVSA